MTVVLIHRSTLYQDSFHQRSCRSSFEELVSAAVDELKNSTEKLRAEKYTVRHLQGVAGARFGLAVTAQALGNLIIDDETASGSLERGDASLHFVPSSVISPSIAQLLSAAKIINRDIDEPQLGFFLVKQLVRSKGLDIIDKLQEKYGVEVQWLTELLQQEAVSYPQFDPCRYCICVECLLLQNEPAMPDYFVVLGEPYRRYREAVARTVTSGETRYVDDLVKVNSYVYV